MLLGWLPAIDLDTPANGMTYNLRLGRAPGAGNVAPPMSNAATGYRRLPQMGNAGQGVTATLQLAPGTYYWSVQAVDSAFAGGPFAAEQSFTIPPASMWGTPTATATATPVREQALFLPVIVDNVPPPTPTPTVTATPPSGWRTIIAEGFEGDFPGPWRVSKGDGTMFQDYYWGKRDCRPFEGSASGWAVGGGATGGSTGCGVSYPNWSYSWMVYGPFGLTDALQAEMRFKLWLNTEPGADGLCYLASRDGENFGGQCVSGNSGGWVDRVFDLSSAGNLGNLVGQPSVWVALVFLSDGSTTLPEGGYVDAILLRKCVTSYCPAAGSDAGASADGLSEFPMPAGPEPP